MASRCFNLQSLMIYDTEHIFICLFGICLSLWVQIFCPGFTELFSYCWGVRILCTFWKQIILHMYAIQLFSPVCGFCSYFLNCIFHRVDDFNFNEVQHTVLFFTLMECGLVLYVKTHSQIQDHLNVLLYCFWNLSLIFFKVIIPFRGNKTLSSWFTYLISYNFN